MYVHLCDVSPSSLNSYLHKSCWISIFSLRFDFGDNDSSCRETLSKNWASSVGSLWIWSNNAASKSFAEFPGLLFDVFEGGGVSLSNEDWNGGDGFVGDGDV